MKALVFEKFGPPQEVLSLSEVSKPTLSENELLIKVHSTTINDYDWSMVRGKPYIYRLMFGIFKPKQRIPGMELSGIVEEIGSKVKSFKKGDAVFGDTSDHKFGTYAEYFAVHEDAVFHKPSDMPFEDAASIPHAALLAWQALVDVGEIKNGMHILINGGGGGVGTIGLQIARANGCKVTGVDSSEKLSMMTSLGFDEVLDYRLTDFTKTGKAYDLILDCKTSKSFFDYRRALNSSGKYVTIGGSLSAILKVLLWSKVFGAGSSKKYRILGLKANKGLSHICELYAQGKISCTIDGPYPMEEAPRLIQFFGEGKHKGKIVIHMH